MKSRVFVRFLPVVLAGMTFVPAEAFACAACMGDPNTKTAGAINGAIFLMLGFVALMLGAVGAFVWNLKKRAGLPIPPQTGFSTAMNTPQNFK